MSKTLLNACKSDSLIMVLVIIRFYCKLLPRTVLYLTGYCIFLFSDDMPSQFVKHMLGYKRIMSNF